jgi:hypothetical protein
MAPKYKEQGGGAATGLADNFIQFLSQGLNSGTFGAGNAAGGDAVGSTQGIAGVLNDILSGGAGNVGGAMAQLIKNDTNDQVLNMRARYGASGGTAFGTGAQYGEGVLRSKQAPAITQAVGGLQLGAIQNLLGLVGNLSQKGIAQRQGTMQENPWVTGASIVANGAGKALGAMANPMAAAGDMIPGGGMQLGPMPGISLTPGGGMPGIVNPSPIGPGSMPQFAAPTLFDYGIR